MTVKEHLASLHSHAAAHHAALAKSFNEASERFSQLASLHSDQPEAFRTHSDLASCLSKVSQQHSDKAEFHRRHAETLDGLDTVKASGFGINPRPEASRAIPRVGQPTIDVDLSRVPAELQQILGVD